MMFALAFIHRFEAGTRPGETHSSFCTVPTTFGYEQLL
jgi:hypothetical protein